MINIDELTVNDLIAVADLNEAEKLRESFISNFFFRYITKS